MSADHAPQVVADLSKAERSALMKFATSVSRAPLGGFQHLIPPLTIHKVSYFAELLAHTDTQILQVCTHSIAFLGMPYPGGIQCGMLFSAGGCNAQSGIAV